MNRHVLRVAGEDLEALQGMAERRDRSGSLPRFEELPEALTDLVFSLRVGRKLVGRGSDRDAIAGGRTLEVRTQPHGNETACLGRIADHCVDPTIVRSESWLAASEIWFAA